MTASGGALWPGQALTLFSVLGARANEDDDHEAVVDESAGHTYASWRRGSEAVARALADAGVGPGDVVALVGDNRPEWLEVAMGVAAVGALFAPLNPRSTASELEYLLRFTAPDVIVTVSATQDGFRTGEVLAGVIPEMLEFTDRWPPRVLPTLRSVVVIGDGLGPRSVPYSSWCRGGTEPVVDRADPSAVAMVLFTSGSTARPKGVCLTHRDLLVNGYEIGERQRLTSDDRVFLASPLFWAFGSANALMASLTHGSTLVLLPRFEAGAALALIERQRCTVIYTLPAMTHALLSHPDFSQERVSSLERGVTIGAPTALLSAVERLGVTSICNIYGSTETYGNCCVTPADAPLDVRTMSQGPPLPGVELRAVDPDGEPIADGRVGEIQVRGRIAPGYLEDDGGLRPIIDQDGWYHTGDLGRLDTEGWLYFTARSDDMIKTSGMNVSPSEVEEVLAAHPAVDEVAVVGGSDAVRGQVVVAFVRLGDGVAATADDLRAHARVHLSSFKVPAIVLLAERLPLTTTGKLDRRTLEARATEELAPGVAASSSSARDLDRVSPPD